MNVNVDVSILCFVHYFTIINIIIHKNDNLVAMCQNAEVVRKLL